MAVALDGDDPPAFDDDRRGPHVVGEHHGAREQGLRRGGVDGIDGVGVDGHGRNLIASGDRAGVAGNRGGFQVRRRRHGASQHVRVTG